ncbi:MAG: MazG nucleotide pyrophosphohydrolase domain-containing protein [Legionella sp.]|nr:MazG nucleotide pyrophosphohydrolase domain-containing protein [Legionella sp.]
MELLDKICVLEKDAERLGFCWENTTQIMAQIESECAEIKEHLSLKFESNSAGLQEEIGDLMHAVFSLSLFCHFDPKDTLSKALFKFEKRINAVRQLASSRGLTTLEGLSFEQIMMYWKDAKNIADKDGK